MKSGLTIQPEVIPQFNMCSPFFACLRAPLQPLFGSLSSLSVTLFPPSAFYSSLSLWRVCLVSGGADLVPQRMMTLAEELAGHCLTVVHPLQPWGQGRTKKKKKEWGEKGEREKQRGRRNRHLLWRPGLAWANFTGYIGRFLITPAQADFPAPLLTGFQCSEAFAQL